MPSGNRRGPRKPVTIPGATSPFEYTAPGTTTVFSGAYPMLDASWAPPNNQFQFASSTNRMWTPPPAWIRNLYPSTTTQTPTAPGNFPTWTPPTLFGPPPPPTAQEPTAPKTQAPASGDRPWLENMFLYTGDGKLAGTNPIYGASWENAKRYKATGDPGALNSFGQPFGTLAPYGQNYNSRARGGQPRKRTPELEAKLQWAHKLLNDLRKNKNNRQPQPTEKGQIAPGWVGGIGQFNV